MSEEEQQPEETKEIAEGRDQKIQRVLYQNDKAMEMIYNNIAAGGTLVELAHTLGIPFWSISAYIDSDDKRKTAFLNAKGMRSEYWFEKIKQLLNELTDTNIQDLYQEDGKLRNIHDLPRVVAASVQSIKTKEWFEGTGKEKEQVGWIQEVKFWDKTKAIEMLAKTLGMFVDRKEIQVHHTLESILAASHDIVDVDKA